MNPWRLGLAAVVLACGVGCGEVADPIPPPEPAPTVPPVTGPTHEPPPAPPPVTTGEPPPAPPTNPPTTACPETRIAQGDRCVPKSVLLLADIESWNEKAYLADITGAIGAAFPKTVVAYDSMANRTPTLAELTPYSAVLLFSRGPANDVDAFGDALAGYFDGGGSIVVALHGVVEGNTGYGDFIGGRFARDGYEMIRATMDWPATSSTTLGPISDPASPLVAGLSVLDNPYSGIWKHAEVAPSATVLASWQNGEPIVARGTVDGRTRVDVNMIPLSTNVYPYSWTGDGFRVITNALAEM